MKEDSERADRLAEALKGEYATSHRWKLAYQKAVAERDAARSAARELNRLQYDDPQDRRRLGELEAAHPWLLTEENGL